jgi:hypothetical protein
MREEAEGQTITWAGWRSRGGRQYKQALRSPVFPWSPFSLTPLLLLSVAFARVLCGAKGVLRRREWSGLEWLEGPTAVRHFF